MADDTSTNDQPTSARKWLAEIETAEKDARKFTKRARDIVKLYTEQARQDTAGVRQYAMLWSNTEVLKPAVYAKAPKPVVTRRFNDQDPAGRQVSEVLERSVTSIFDRSDVDDTLKLARDDFILVGQGVAWARYEPTFGMNPGNADLGLDPYEEVQDETVCFDFVAWSDFIRPKSRNWTELPWLARRCYKDDKEGEERFSKIVWDKVKAAREQAASKNGRGDGVIPRDTSIVYEIWSKRDKLVIWVAKNYEDILDQSPPMYDLHGFYPCPRPAFATMSTDDLTPIPDYVFYQDQAEEINTLTAKIAATEDLLKMLIFYPAGASGGISDAIEKALSPYSTSLGVPVPSFTEFKQGGGAGGLVDFFPIDKVTAALNEMLNIRRAMIEDVYQITGISDIIRGASDPNETATAQGIKAQWGGLRIRDKQQEMARIGRDLARITAEIVSEKFQPETIWRMTGLKYPTAAQKAEIQAQVGGAGGQPQGIQANQGGISGATPNASPPGFGPGNALQPSIPQASQGQAPSPSAPPVASPGQPSPSGQPPPPPPIPPQIQRLLDGPTQEDIIGLMRDDQVRSYRVDVETDSTIEADQNAMQQSRTAALTAIGNFIQQSVPLLQAAPDLAPVVGESLLFLVRSFPAARSLEEVIEQGVEKIEQKAQIGTGQPDPAQAEAQAKQQAQTEALQQQNQLKQADLALRQQELQGRQQIEQSKVQIAGASIASKHQIESQRLVQTAQDQGSDKQLAGADLVLRAQDQSHNHRMAYSDAAQSAEMQGHTIAQAGLEQQDQAQDQNLAQAVQQLGQRQQATEDTADQILQMLGMIAKSMGITGSAVNGTGAPPIA